MQVDSFGRGTRRWVLSGVAVRRFGGRPDAVGLQRESDEPVGQHAFPPAEGKKGGELFLELVNIAPPAVKTYTFADVNKAIQVGQAVMGIQWASGAKPMEDKTRSAVAGKLGYSVVPRGTRVSPMRGVWTIAIAKSSPNQDAAWEFAKWLSSREFGLASTRYPSAISAIHSPRVSVLTDPGTQEALPYAGVLLESLRVAKERPRLKEYADIQDSLRIIAGKLTAGELNLNAALQEMDAATNKMLAK